MGAPCRIEFEFVDEIEPAPSGKHFYLISKVARQTRAASVVPGETPSEHAEI
jgi:hypothetical protein